MTIAIALHLALLAWLIAAGSVPAARRLPVPLTINLSLPPAADDAAAPAAAGSPPEAAPRPLPPAAPTPPPEIPLPSAETLPFDPPALVPQFDAEPDPAVTGDVTTLASPNAVGLGAGGDCSLADAVSQALERNVDAKAALARIPPQSRSVANAVMLWDGDWIASERVGGPVALNSVQKAIAETLDSASAECRLRSESGPSFLIVRGSPDTIVLAVGSGAWRWSDLLTDVREEGN